MQSVPSWLPPGFRISAVIPALNEEHAIGQVIAEIPAWVAETIVCDNGSTDRTAEIAAAAGARVIRAGRRGYGSACQAGIQAADRPDVIVFLDGDFSDYPAQMDRLVRPIAVGRADMVIGSRIAGRRQRGALTLQQRFGGALACLLMQVIWGVAYTDLGPFRAISAAALGRLHMDDPDFGWTIQMQIRAAQAGLRCVETPVDYRCRIGQSKISGTIRGVAAAGWKILFTIWHERWNESRHLWK